jgi:hypothetical protein
MRLRTRRFWDSRSPRQPAWKPQLTGLPLVTAAMRADGSRGVQTWRQAELDDRAESRPESRSRPRATRSTPFGEVGTVFSGQGIEMVWVSKLAEPIDEN